jgi:hypothetical protein
MFLVADNYLLKYFYDGKQDIPNLLLFSLLFSYLSKIFAFFTKS